MNICGCILLSKLTRVQYKCKYRTADICSCAISNSIRTLFLHVEKIWTIVIKFYMSLLRLDIFMREFLFCDFIIILNPKIEVFIEG